MVEPANGSPPDGLRSKRELLYLDQPSQRSSAFDGQATGARLARTIGTAPSTEPPLGWRDLPAFGTKILLDNPRERICYRCDVQKSQAIAATLSGAGASRHHQFLQCRRDAFS